MHTKYKKKIIMKSNRGAKKKKRNRIESKGEEKKKRMRDVISCAVRTNSKALEFEIWKGN